MLGHERSVYGWDIGGAHLKACRLRNGEVVDVAQWACALWQGLDQLERAIQAARERWPDLGAALHAVTMTGEMVDLFKSREDGVRRIAALVAERLPALHPVRFFAGSAGWCSSGDVARHWLDIASANWLATAQHAAHCLKTRVGHGVLIDVGSTTTDLIAFGAGRVLSTSRTDAQRLASGELVYHGVVRTPLCAVAARIDWRGTPLNVMNEYFATAADVYRLTGELNPAYDLHPAADHGAKDPAATRQRLARMIGLDERDGTPEDWHAFAQAWRSCQVAELASQLQRVMALHALPVTSTIVSAGCGDFLVTDIVARAMTADAGRPCIAYGTEVARVATAVPLQLAAWAQVCAACVAVATLLDEDER
jgi:(4-(4-[2-(gamma-L-glutamylamino)ethyl]phenoxymethyl)furan-2-yl)methanamine synthase